MNTFQDLERRLLRLTTEGEFGWQVAVCVALLVLLHIARMLLGGIFIVGFLIAAILLLGGFF